MKHPNVRRVTALFTLLQVVSCGGKQPPKTGHGSASPISDLVLVQTKDLPDGLDLAVSEARQGAPAFDRGKLAPAQKLPDGEAQALLARGQPIAADPDDKQAFALRPGSQPPPRTGKVIGGQFPPPASSLLPPPSVKPGELRVLRYMPEGKVPLAPELSVTFSQPMVAVTSQDDAAGVQPVKLTPTPAGRWRWLGTRTLLFDPAVRFPQATTYQIEVPANIHSATGEALKEAVKFTFETPAVTLTGSSPSPYTPQHLDVPMFARFDQKIDASAVLAKIHVTANGKPVAIAMLDAAAIAKDKQLAATVDATKKDEQDGRWLAFHATQPFPTDAAIDVEIAAGTPSAEGPNLTTAPQHFGFHTFPPLAITQSTCGWGSECHPGMPYYIQFNNPLDGDKFDDSQVTVTPAIAGEKIQQSGNSLTITGQTKAHASYHVTIAGGLRDEFGQTLGKPAELDWTVGSAMPTFFGPNGMVVVDPAAKQPTLDFFSTNYEQLKVRLYKVAPSDFDAYTLYLRERWNHDHPPTVPGKKVFDQLVATPRTHDELVETSVDLAPALAGGLGDVIAVVEPYPWKQTYEPPTLVAWVQSTRLAIDAHVDGDHLVAFATELATGKPAAGVALEIRPFGIAATSDTTGLASLPLSRGGAKGQHFLVGTRGNDVAFVAENNYYGDGGSWTKQARGTNLAWYVIDDRHLYKPGEEVSLKGWLRTIGLDKGGDVTGLDGAVSGLTFKVNDSQGNQIAIGDTKVSAVGGFDAKFTIPKTPNLGYAYIQFSTVGRLGGQPYTHGFQIEEFRRPEFSVSTAASQGPFVVGGSGEVAVSAKYYAGGPLAGAETRWQVTTSQTNFTPPNRDDYVFGSWTPWWGYRSYFEDDEGNYGRGYKPPKTWTLAGKTDATGAHAMHLDFLSVKPAMPMSVVTQATVIDVNRQAWTSSTALIVHPSLAYVGVKTKKPFVERGQPFDVDVVGVDLDGKAIVGARIEVKSVRLDYEYKKGHYVQKEVDPQTCAIVAAKDAVPCSLATKTGGTYQLTATIVDAKGRPNQTKLTYWVSGGDQPPAREVKQEVVQIIPDKKAYAPGNTAELLVQAPFYPAEAIVSWRRSGMVKVERVTFDGPTKVLTVPITDAMTPNLTVQVDLVGAAARTDDHGVADPKLPKRPAYAVGSIDLPIPPKHRALTVTVSPAEAKLAPGASTHLALDVRDAKGQPVANAEAAVIVVDEAILALAGYEFPDPIGAFYPQRDGGTRDYYLRQYVTLAKPDTTTLTLTRGASAGSGMLYEASVDSAPTTPAGTPPPPPPAPPSAQDRGGREENKDVNQKQPNQPQTGPIAIRSNFNPLAAFAPAVSTDANGKATVDIKLPDNLTRYRIIAVVAAGDKQYGKGESAVTARLPLMVRPSPPRFLNFGDTFRLPVVVQNQTDAPMTVKLAIRTTNATITDGAGRSVMVPANDRVEVQFPAAAEMAGTARFQIVGTNGRDSDAAELALPVWTPATTEAFATYGVIDDGAIRQPVALPGKVVTQFGGLEVTTASTNLQALTDALLYLVHYPFECAEQRSSRILAIAALKDVLVAFKTKDMPTQAAMEASVKIDIEHLSQMQNGDGGFAYWDRGHPSEPYLSVYVANALAHAAAKGFSVPTDVLVRVKPYLQNIERFYPWYYSADVRHAISAYALYTRMALGDRDVAKGKKLLAEAGGVDKVTMETDGWLLGLFAGDKAAEPERKAIVRYAMNHVSETAGAANFTTGYGDGGYLLLSSDRRVDAVMLESLIAEQPSLDLIPKVVTGLLAHRKAGRWLNTQENTFALLALDLYFHTYEKVTPDFVARVWLGADYAGDHAFKGRTTDYFQLAIPMAAVATHDKADLAIQKDGKGRLYYRIGMTYAPASLKLEAADYGFVVARSYVGVDDPKDVTRGTDGVWHVKAGARVRVELQMANENRRYHVALVDPMPAGFEAMNPSLATTGAIPTDPNEQKSRGAYWWWYGPWYEHQNLRDERVEAFAALLWEGVHRYSYVARATTPGNFVVPPTKAEEMYMPETFGRSASDRVVVE